MIDPKLLEILCCPETRQTLRTAPSELIDRLNRQIGEGQIRNRTGVTVREPMDGGLLREDGKFLYVIREGIPVMLTDEAIPLTENPAAPETSGRGS